MNAPYAENQFRAGGLARGYLGQARRWSVTHVPGGRRSLWIALAAVLIGLLVWFVGPSEKTRRGAHSFGIDNPIPVGVARVQRGDVRVTLDALGAVTPLATVTIKPEVSGIMQKIDFREGQMVRAGDLLAEIDPRPYQAALDQAKGALARDQAQYANARIDLKRYQTLWAQNAVSQQILATQEALVRTDAGTVEADKGAVEAAAVNLTYCKITSPVTGQVGLRQIDVGNYVQVGVTTEIVVVTELQPMSVLFTLPEDDLAQVTGRIRAGAKLPVTAYDRSQTTRLASGTLSTMDNEIDPTTGTVKLRALFDNSDLRLFPSQFVNVRLLVNTLHGQATVPVAAIQHGAAGDYVFVVKHDQTVGMRNVSLGPADGDMVAVKRGAVPGDEVVVDGADRLRDGARVVIPGSKGFMPSWSGAKRRDDLASGRHRHHHWHGAGGGNDSP